jgi:histidyl-tRNA synthetase
MTIASPKGVYDVLPIGLDKNDLWRRSDLWQYVESIALNLASYYGFREIRTPLFERTELFQRGVGESSDIVSKEMFTFLDKAGRSMTLRPELTASVMRAFVEKKLHQYAPIHKLYYLGPMFRYDRPQAGRYRQFSQFGVEAIGSHSPEQDVELIDFLYTLYQRLGLKNLTLHLNSVGDPECRVGYKHALQEFLHPHKEKLSEDSKVRLEMNPLRILDSKDKGDQALLEGAPSILEFLNEECQSQLNEVCELLQKINIPYSLNAKLVRGLDYYNKTVFEVSAGELGAQNTIGAGGRYDGLLKTLGGPDLPAVGWATGIERIIQTMLAQEVFFPEAPAPTLFMIPLGNPAKSYCFNLLKQLRDNKISSEMDFSGKKLKDALRYADQIKASFTLVVGDSELENGQAELKEMSNRTSRKISLSRVLEELQQLIKL